MKRLKKLALMHRLFGADPEHQCKSCCNFSRDRYHGKSYGKCKVYGISSSSATDWAGRNIACGMYDQNTRHCNAMEVVMYGPEAESLENEQMMLDLIIGGK